MKVHVDTYIHMCTQCTTVSVCTSLVQHNKNAHKLQGVYEQYKVSITNISYTCILQSDLQECWTIATLQILEHHTSRIVQHHNSTNIGILSWNFYKCGDITPPTNQHRGSYSLLRLLISGSTYLSMDTQIGESVK